MVINCRELNFAYNYKNIIEKISIEIEPGQLTSITGPNGVGKSTLLKCLCNIYKPAQGVIYINGKELTSINPRELAKILGYVPQREHLSFNMTVYEMILLGRRPYLKWKVTARDETVVEAILKRLKLEQLAARELDTLSGGERQKVAIARALAQEPEILLLDEPTSSLDINHQLEVIKRLQELAYKEKTTVVIVLHDLNLASRFSDKVLLMGGGGYYKMGSPREVFTPESIRNIYDIEVEIMETSQGHFIIPLDTEAV